MHQSSVLDYPLEIVWDASVNPAAFSHQASFIRTPRPDADPAKNEVFRAGGLIDPSGAIADRDKLYHLMVLLEARMHLTDDGQLWSEALGPVSGPGLSPADNPFLPSGYTYLLQLIAHDMVDTVRAMVAVKGGSGGAAVASPLLRNARARPLMLDTIYGAGPDESPQAYSAAVAGRQRPRSHLRLGTIRPVRTGQALAAADPPVPRTFCPFRDIARAAAPVAGELRDQSAITGLAPMPEAFIADPRNDAHALISQMTVLFHTLHELVLVRLERNLLSGSAGGRDAATRNSIEFAYRLFLAARYSVTLLYRHIIEEDVLARILDPVVYALYRDRADLRLHREASVAREFTFGAFRFGHAMVRERYRTNQSRLAAAGFEFAQAHEQSAQRNAGNVPVSREWAVDWALFFDPARAPNLARRIGPFYSSGLMQETSKATFDDAIAFALARAEIDSRTDRGLPTRDFLSSAYAGLWSVPALLREVREALAAQGADPDIVPDFAAWQDSLKTWLALTTTGADDLPAAEFVDRIVADPPLPFFIQFEAAHAFEATPRKPRPAVRVPAVPPGVLDRITFPGQGGRTLGPLGSIIVADTLFPILRSAPFGFDETGLSLRQRIETVLGGLVNAPRALDALTRNGEADRKLDTMLDLLVAMKDLDDLGRQEEASNPALKQQIRAFQ